MMRPSSSKTTGLGAAGADHVPRRSERDRDLDAVGVRDAATGGEVGRPDADEHRRRGAADRRVLAGARGGVDRGGEHVVALLVGGAGCSPRLGEARPLLVGHGTRRRSAATGARRRAG